VLGDMATPANLTHPTLGCIESWTVQRKQKGLMLSLLSIVLSHSLCYGYSNKF